MLYAVAADGQWLGDVEAESDDAARAAARAQWPGRFPVVTETTLVEGRLRRLWADHWQGRLHGFPVEITLDYAGRWGVTIYAPLPYGQRLVELVAPTFAAARWRARRWIEENRDQRFDLRRRRDWR